MSTNKSLIKLGKQQSSEEKEKETISNWANSNGIEDEQSEKQ